MRVLIHCVYYSPEVGGLESHIVGLATGLVRRGVEVRVVTSRSVVGSASEEEIEGVRVRRRWLPSRSPAGWFGYAIASAPLARRWAAWAQVVHAQSFASVPPARFATWGRKRPLVASFHTSHFLRRARRRIWAPVLGALVRWPDHVLAASREIAEVASRLGNGRYVEALTNGVDTDAFRPLEADDPEARTTRTVLVPRRLFEKNGVEYLVRAVPLIRSRVPNLRVLVIGDGPERPRLETLARELGVGPAVEFLGSRPHEEMPALLSRGEIAIFPSLMEATSVAALEAMSCGRPVVASAVGGLPEIVDAEVGDLVPPGDPEALATSVIRLLESDHLAETGRRARERVVERWSNDRLVERHLEIYGALLEGRDPRPSIAGDH